MNEANGALVSLRRLQVQQALELLGDGREGSSVYGASGQTNKLPASHTLAKA